MGPFANVLPQMVGLCLELLRLGPRVVGIHDDSFGIPSRSYENIIIYVIPNAQEGVRTLGP